MVEVYQNTSGCHALVQVVKRNPEFAPNFLDSVKIFIDQKEEMKDVIFEKTMSCIKDLVTYFGFLQDLLPHLSKKLNPVFPNELPAAMVLGRCISHTLIPSLYG